MRSDGIACVKWKDKRCVMFLSTIESPQEMSTVNRKESDGSITQIQCPRRITLIWVVSIRLIC